MQPSKQKEWYWGHPDAEPIDSREYSNEREEVSSIILEHADHPSIQDGVDRINDWLKEAYDARYYLYKYLLDRLWATGIRGSDILIESSALLLFRVRNPRRFMNDRHYVHVLGSKVIRIIPYSDRTKGYEHWGIGLSTHKKIGGVSLDVCKTVIIDQRKSREIKDAMNVPLEI